MPTTSPRGPRAVCLGAAIGCRRTEPAADPADLVLADVTVIDGLGGPPMPARTIEIRDGTISAVREARPGESDPPGVRGRCVVPSLIDSHVHVGQEGR